MMGAANFALVPYAFDVFHFRIFDVVPVARHTVIEKMPDGVIVLDPENRFAGVNEAAQKILGVVKLKVIGRNVNEILHNFPELLRLVHYSSETQCEALVGDTCARWYHISISPPEMTLYVTLLRTSGRIIQRVRLRWLRISW